MARSNQSNSIALSEINDQLFTEVTPEQSSVVEGGLRVQLLSIRCLEAGGGSDQVFAQFNGVNGSVGGASTFMRKGFFANFSQAGGGSASSVLVRLRDKSNGNASLGSFTVSSKVRNSQTRVISGNGSRYEVTFNAPF